MAGVDRAFKAAGCSASIEMMITVFRGAAYEADAQIKTMMI
jgi:hypothetical protein